MCEWRPSGRAQHVRTLASERVVGCGSAVTRARRPGPHSYHSLPLLLRVLSLSLHVTNLVDTRRDGFHEAMRCHGRPVNQAADRTSGSACTSNTLFTQWAQIERTEKVRVDGQIKGGDSAPAEEAEVGILVEAQLTPCPDSVCSLEPAVLEMVYRDAIKVLVHRMGCVRGTHRVGQPELLEFVRSAFGMEEARHSLFVQKEEKEEGPKKVLRLTVHEGRNLKAMDENGLSDPFAVIGIVHLSDEDFEEANRRGKMRKVDRMTAQLVQTSVQTATLDPVWDDQLDLTVGNVKCRYLQLDLWDYDEATISDTVKSVKNIAGVKGAKRWVKDLADHARAKPSDDFMGRFLFPLEAIPQEGCESWYYLEDRHRQLKGGQLRLRMEFRAKQSVIPLNPDWHPSIVYRHLYKQCILTELYTLYTDKLRRSWNYKLTNACANTVLCQYRIQHNMSDLHVELVEFSVLVGLLKEHAVDYQRLSESLAAILYMWKNQTNGILRKDEVEQLLADFVLFKDHCLGLLSRLRQVFPTGRQQSMVQLRHVLSCLERIYSHPIIQKEYPTLVLADDIRSTVQLSTTLWYEYTWELCSPQEVSGASFAEQLIKLVHAVTDDLVEANHCYNQYFVTGVCYFTTIFVTLDRRMCSNIESTIKLLVEDLRNWSSMGEEGVELCSTTFKLFMTVRQLLKYYNILDEKYKSQMHLSEYSEWFQGIVTVWFEVSEYKALQMVDKAVQLDKAVKVAKSLKYSTSAVDIGNTIIQMVQFWRQLDWPDAKNKFCYIVLLLNTIHNVVGKYCEHIVKKLEKVGYYDDEGQFDVTEELCVIQNSLDHVGECMEGLPVDLEWDTLADQYEKVEAGGCKKANLLCEQMMDSFRDDMNNKRHRIVEQITKRMSRDISHNMVQYVQDVSDGVGRDEALNGLMTYLDTNLQTMFTELFNKTFKVVVAYLWESIMAVMKFTLLCDSEMVREQRKIHGVLYYQNIKYLFDVLVGFFESDTLSMEARQLKTESYKELYSKINTYSQDSTMLMREYYQSLYTSQLTVDMEDRCPFGAVGISMAYNEPKSELVVTVLHAKNLPAMDSSSVFSSAKSDPYIVLSLEPQELFPNIVEQKTTTQMDTLTPLYDETFRFKVSPESQQTPGCSLQLHCYDWDRFKCNDFIGEAVVPILLSELGCAKSVRGKTHMLPLCHPQTKHDGAFNVLCTREEFSNDAANFLKRRRKVFQQAADTYAMLLKRNKK